MDAIATEARRIHLDILVRVRRLGWWPWLVLAGWVGASAAQEPRLLRPFGINLCWQAAWSGGAILLVALSALGAQGGGAPANLRQNVNRILVPPVLVVLVGLSQALFAWVADIALGPWTPLSLVPLHAAGFGLVWLPTALAGALTFGGRNGGVGRLLLLVPVAFSLAGSTLWFTGPTAALVLACILATVGAGCLGALSPRTAVAAAERRDPAEDAHDHRRSQDDRLAVPSPNRRMP